VLVLREHGWQLGLDIAQGHKTGYYLDQRDSRQRFAHYVQRLQSQRVLNCYCYTGGFSVAALSGGAAHVTSIDSSAPALALAASNVARNGFAAERAEFIDADVNASLRRFAKEGRRFDAIVLDPPKLAPTIAHAERAARAYKDINRLALQILEPQGVLFTFSCSGGISADLFHKIVASAGADAGVDGFISERLGAAPDHPMTLSFANSAGEKVVNAKSFEALGQRSLLLEEWGRETAKWFVPFVEYVPWRRESDLLAQILWLGENPSTINTIAAAGYEARNRLSNEKLWSRVIDCLGNEVVEGVKTVPYVRQDIRWGPYAPLPKRWEMFANRMAGSPKLALFWSVRFHTFAAAARFSNHIEHGMRLVSKSVESVRRKLKPWQS
jgi:hypothetical protein